MSATAIIAILDVVFVLILLIGFWAGFRRGVKRSALEFGLSFVGIIICGFITPPITNAILGINITVDGTTTSLQGLIANLISQDETFGTLIESSPSLEAFLTNLPSVLLCAFVFLILNLVMRLIVYIIYKIIAVIAFKSKKQEKAEGLKRNGWIGGAIGTLKMFMLLLVISMPVTSLIKLADTQIYEAKAAVAEGNASPVDETLDGLPQTAKDILHAIDDSAFGVLNGAVGLDDYIFDNISQFEVNGEKVQVRKEVSTYLGLIRDVSAIETSNQVSTMDWDKIDGLYQTASQSGLYKAVVLNVVGELIDDYPTLISLFPELGEFEQIFADVKEGMNQATDYATYLGDDINNIYYTVSDLGRSGYLDYVLGEEQLDVATAITLLSQQYTTVMTGSIDKIIDMNIVRDSLSSLLDYALSMLADDEIGTIFQDANTNISNWEVLKSQLKTILIEFGDINTQIEANGVSFADIINDLANVLLIKNNVPQILSNVGSMLDTVDGMEIMKDNRGNKILPQVLQQFGINNLLDVKGENITTYKGLFEFVATPVENLISLDLYDVVTSGSDYNQILKKFAQRLASEMTTDGETTTYSTFLQDTLLPIYKVTALKEIAIDQVIEQSANTGVIDFSLLEVEGDFDASYANWQTDLPLLAQIISELESRQFDETQTMFDYLLAGGDINEVVKMLDDEAVDDIVPAIMQAKSTQPLKDKLSGVIVDVMQDVTGQQGLTLPLSTATFNPSSEEDQTAEFITIVKNFVNIYKNTSDLTSLENIDAAALGNLIESIKQNAYRQELHGKQEEGVMRSIFDALITAAQTQFDFETASLLDVAGKQYIYEVDFTQMFELLDLINEANEFASAFKDLALGNLQTDEETQQAIGSLMDTVEENQETVEQILDIATNLEFNIELSQENQVIVEERIEQLAQNENISSSIIENLRNIFGVGA